MASVPPQHDHDAQLASEANATPLGTRHSERMRRQSAARTSEEHQSMSHDEPAVDTSPSDAVDQNLIPSNGVVENTPTSRSNVVQEGIPPAVPAQSAEPSDQVASIVSSSVAVIPAADVQEKPETVLGKRRQSDASVTRTSNKRTKTDDLEIVPSADNNEILGSTTEPRPNLNESAQHNDDTRPAPVSKADTPWRIPESEQSASGVEDAAFGPQIQDVDHARNPTDNPHTSPERELRPPPGDTTRWPSGGDDLTAYDALYCLEDPERQDDLAQHHRRRAIRLGKGLLQKSFDQVSTGRFNEADGWMKSASRSRAQGRHEIGLIAEYPMPVLRADPSPPSPSSVFWVPGPDRLVIMCKLCLGLIVMNDHNVKMIRTFTTKSGTDIGRLRGSGDLQYYAQVVRSPQEDRAIIEKGIYDVFKFESFNDQGVNWKIEGPRLMETMSMYQHPHGKPYRIVGKLKGNGYDEDLLVKIWKMNYEIGERETRRAFRERREDPNWASRYRNVAQSNIGDDTVVAEVSLSRIMLLGSSFCTNVVLVTCVAACRKCVNCSWSEASSGGEHCRAELQSDE